jgi:hypothetical protein
MITCHSERSEAQSKNPVEEPVRNAAGSLDFARDDGETNINAGFSPVLRVDAQ